MNRDKGPYCIMSSSGLKTFFSNKKRVSKLEFYKKYPNFDEKKCILIQNRQKIKKDLENLLKIKKDLDELENYKQELIECNKKLSTQEEIGYSNILSLKRNYESRIIKYKNRIEELNEIQNDLSQKHKKILKDLEISSINYNRNIEEKINIIRQLYLQIEENKLEINSLNESVRLFEIDNRDLINQLDECKKYNKDFKDELQNLFNIKKDLKDQELLDEISQQISYLNEKLILSSSHQKNLEDVIKQKNFELTILRTTHKKNKELMNRISQLESELGEYSKLKDYNLEEKENYIKTLEENLKESNNQISQLYSYLNNILQSNKLYEESIESIESIESESVEEKITKELKKFINDDKKIKNIVTSILSIPDISKNNQELKVDQYESYYDFFIKKMKKIMLFGKNEIENNIDDTFKNNKTISEKTKKNIKQIVEKSWFHKFKPIVLSSAALILGNAAMQSVINKPETITVPTKTTLTIPPLKQLTKSHIQPVETIYDIEDMSKILNAPNIIFPIANLENVRNVSVVPLLDSKMFDIKIDQLLSNQPNEVVEVVNDVVKSLSPINTISKPVPISEENYFLKDQPEEVIKTKKEIVPNDDSFKFSDYFDLGEDSFEFLKNIYFSK